MNFILDTSAIIAVFCDEPGADEVRSLLAEPENHFSVHAVNVIEVFYRLARARGEASPIGAAIFLREVGIRVRERIELSFARDVARVKTLMQRISLADCVCIGLARQMKGRVLTADRGEFTAVRDARICGVHFIR